MIVCIVDIVALIFLEHSVEDLDSIVADALIATHPSR